MGCSLADLTTVTDWDGTFHENRRAAKKAGWKARGSDDFNIGVVRDGKLVSVDWMDEPIGETPEAITDIAIEIGLEEDDYGADEDEPEEASTPTQER
ncbi:MAG: hypothetical protein WAP03_21655 [Methylorubrum rhodinum]|uniref:hypothetical protein n=1 Tax=Methylorubrum rhodinum TaxID=29428 RepID=UPI003BB1E721